MIILASDLFTCALVFFCKGYKYSRCGSFFHCGAYSNPPCEPILFGLTPGLRLRQVSTYFPLLPEAAPGTIPYSTGHIKPSEVVMVPETGVFEDIDIEAGVRKAEVRVVVFM